jgi:hypothetical protein
MLDGNVDFAALQAFPEDADISRKSSKMSSEVEESFLKI